MSKQYGILNSVKIQFNWSVNLCEGIMDVSHILDIRS